MKLYNKTQCPDAILRDLLTRAGRAAGARTGGVVVKVTSAQHRVSGNAYRMWSVFEWHLRPRSKSARAKSQRGRSIRTDGGYIEIRLPVRSSRDVLSIAESFWNIAVHEWGHIRDYQSRNPKPFSSKGLGGRRPNWADRPEEIRAERVVCEAEEKIEAGKIRRPDEAILALALWLESN